MAKLVCNGSQWDVFVGGVKAGVATKESVKSRWVVVMDSGIRRTFAKKINVQSYALYLENKQMGVGE
mgnify:CR=1 FL=1